MIRRPPRSTLFPYTNALPIFGRRPGEKLVAEEYLPGTLRTLETLGDAETTWALGGFLTTVSALPWFVEERRSEEHTSELQSQSNLVCRLLLEKKKQNNIAASLPLETHLKSAAPPLPDDDARLLRPIEASDVRKRLFAVHVFRPAIPDLHAVVR